MRRSDLVAEPPEPRCKQDFIYVDVSDCFDFVRKTATLTLKNAIAFAELERLFSSPSSPLVATGSISLCRQNRQECLIPIWHLR